MTTHYCQLCGTPLTYQGEQPDYRTGHAGETYAIVACKNARCKLNDATVTVAYAATQDFANAWKFVPVYNLLTGERITREE